MKPTQIFFIFACCAWTVNGSPTLVRKKRHPQTLEFMRTSGNLAQNGSKEVEGVGPGDRLMSGDPFGHPGQQSIPESVNRVIVVQNEDKWKAGNEGQDRKIVKAKEEQFERPHSKAVSHAADVHHPMDLGMKHKKSPNKHRSHHSDKSESQMKLDFALNKVPLTFSLSSNEVDKSRGPQCREDIDLMSKGPNKQHSVEISNVVVKFGLDNSGASKYFEPLPISDPFIGLNPFPHLFDGIPAVEPPSITWEAHFCPIHSPYRMMESMGESPNLRSNVKCTCKVNSNSGNANENEVSSQDYPQNQKMNSN